ncbi:MAG: hypothetical protein IT374_14630 [Polyangiaceae bacterium]|nr:hypothetical protein [Polyangiaceae bacterium]
MPRRRDVRAPVLLGAAIVCAAAVSFYVATPSPRGTPGAPSSRATRPLPPPSSTSTVVPVFQPAAPPGVIASAARPSVGPDEHAPAPPLVIASETPPPFDVPDGGCPEGTQRAESDAGAGCAYRDADGGLVLHGPGEARINERRVERGQWFNGRRQGPWTWLDEEGRKVKITYYDHDGQLDGPEREYDAQGNVIAERWFSRSSLHGVEVRRSGDKERRTRWDMGRKVSEETVEIDAGAAGEP